MEARAYVHLEEVREGRTYHLSMPMGATYKEAEEVALGFIEGIRELARKSDESQASLPEQVQDETPPAQPSSES